MDYRRAFDMRGIVWVASIYLVAVAGHLYEFILDNDEIFDNCPQIEGNNGIWDLGDLTEMTFTYDEGRIKCSGNATVTWEGVQPTDRIEVFGELYKFHRGSWQPTLISNSFTDFCKHQFEKNTLCYDLWTRHINPADHKCLNNVGHTYHHEPFEVNTQLELVGKMEGRYKLITYVNAYDEKNTKRSKTLCFQIFGEFVKVKSQGWITIE